MMHRCFLLFVGVTTVSILGTAMFSPSIAEEQNPGLSLLWSYTLGGGIIPTGGTADLVPGGGLELVVGDGPYVWAFTCDGEYLWSYHTGTGSNACSEPTVADIRDDSTPEVLVVVDQAVICLNADGKEVWRYRFDSVGTIQNTSGGVAVADLDGDGSLEVLASGMFDNCLYCLHPEDGSINWSFPTGYLVGTAPLVVDLEGDGEPEILFSSYDRHLYCLNQDGTERWNYYTPGSGITGWILSTPAAADVDDDGYLEVAGSSNYHSLFLLDHEGNLLWEYRSGAYANSSPAIGDIDNDGEQEIVWGFGQYVRAYDPDGTLLWTFGVASGTDVVSSPALADLDGDGTLEIAFGEFHWPPSGQRAFVVDHLGNEIWSEVVGGLPGSPIVADLNLDGQLEMAIVGRNDNLLRVYQSDQILEPGRMDWPQFHHDRQKTGFYGFVLELPPVEVSLAPDNTVVPRGGTLGLTITVHNTTDQAQTFRCGTMVRLPNGKLYGPVLGPKQITLQAGASRNKHINHHVPGNAPLGDYTYIAKVGPAPGETWDTDSFDFTVVEAITIW
jgi:outer membrane protein assembly factor BamB